MHYMLMIYENEALMAERSAAEQQAIFGEYSAFSGELRDDGAFVAGDPLQPSSTATCVKVRNGKRITTDGPYAETKEQLGGYYLLNCKTLDEALAYAARIPTARDGVIEVRPVMELEG